VIANTEEAEAKTIAPNRHPTEDVARGGRAFTGPRSTGRSLLEHLKTVPKWAGDDLEERLDEVVRARGEAHV
jgi:hypothetical protein